MLFSEAEFVDGEVVGVTDVLQISFDKFSFEGASLAFVTRVFVFEGWRFGAEDLSILVFAGVVLVHALSPFRILREYGFSDGCCHDIAFHDVSRVILSSLSNRPVTASAKIIGVEYISIWDLRCIWQMCRAWYYETITTHSACVVLLLFIDMHLAVHWNICAYR